MIIGEQCKNTAAMLEELDKKRLLIIIIIITKEYDYGGVMSRGLQGHLTNEIVGAQLPTPKRWSTRI